MKSNKYSIEKIIQILSEAKMDSISSVCRKYNICSTTFYRWQKTYSGFSSDQAKKLAILEQENDSLKKLVADKELENFALREFIKKTIFKGNNRLSQEYECSCEDNLQKLQYLKSKAVQASQQTL